MKQVFNQAIVETRRISSDLTINPLHLDSNDECIFEQNNEISS
jgi:hypothetical protein